MSHGLAPITETFFGFSCWLELFCQSEKLLQGQLHLSPWLCLLSQLWQCGRLMEMQSVPWEESLVGESRLRDKNDIPNVVEGIWRCSLRNSGGHASRSQQQKMQGHMV